ncbi:hypothetical protein GCM10010912_10620 [Paenibacillus albidus]|uniref:Uncharacterized protein n=1 Tax=Paenibacillus albidus TaxID=2041023 RepID=A0A917C2G8_9BACL|nr:hypothetical protein [Paenibacillus albidus]GGF67511.1 hypothetical protein GCM10010912_10620 [Paenibacillus albidus]
MKQQFLIMAPLYELAYWPDEDAEEYLVHPNFQNIMDALNITIPFHDIYENALEQPVHTGHVLKYVHKDQPGTYIILDTYQDPIDQLGMVQFGWCGTDNHNLIQQLSRKLYDECEHKAYYHEGQSVLYKLARPEQYPRTIRYGDKLFQQELKIYQV